MRLPSRLMTPAAWMTPITLSRSQPNYRARTGDIHSRRNLSVDGTYRRAQVKLLIQARCMNLATSMTTLECEPIPISLAPSVALTVNSICGPSTLVTSASPLTKRPTGVAARWRTLTAVPTALSPGSR